MMRPTIHLIELVLERITSAASPEAVFGELTGTPACQEWKLRLVRRNLAQAIDPRQICGFDVRQQATQALTRLDELFEEARQRITAGTYGQKEAA